MERWEVILHFMVGSPNAAVSHDLAQLLVQAGLMKRYLIFIVPLKRQSSNQVRRMFRKLVLSTQTRILLVSENQGIAFLCHHMSCLVVHFSEAGEAPYITSAGFQFLLLDTASQLWYFTLQYLKTAQVLACQANVVYD